MSSQQRTHSHMQNQNSGYVGGPSTPARVVSNPWHRRPEQPNYIPPCFAQPVTPHYDPQPLAQDGFRNLTSTQFQPGNDAYWGNSINDFNHDDATEASRIEAPAPWNGGEYAPPQLQNGHFVQGGMNHTGIPFVAEPLANLAMNLPQRFPGTSAAPSNLNQGASPVWKLSNCWVGYEVQDEIHLTIVFRKAPFT